MSWLIYDVHNIGPQLHSDTPGSVECLKVSELHTVLKIFNSIKRFLVNLKMQFLKELWRIRLILIVFVNAIGQFHNNYRGFMECLHALPREKERVIKSNGEVHFFQCARFAAFCLREALKSQSALLTLRAHWLTAVITSVTFLRLRLMAHCTLASTVAAYRSELQSRDARDCLNCVTSATKTKKQVSRLVLMFKLRSS